MHKSRHHPILDRQPQLRAAADAAGFECLDTDWRGLSAMYRFQCREGHLFQRTLQTFGRALEAKCPLCAAASNFGRLRELSRQNGVTCLEPHWLGWDAPHRFQCEAGHAWNRKGNKALQRIGCAVCGRDAGYRRRRDDLLQRIHQTAASRGGQCLDTASPRGQRTFLFRCGAGHEWEAAGVDVLRRTWCPECARLRKVEGYRHPDGLERLQRKAAERGGACLADTYGGLGVRYRFRCAEGHEWLTTGGKVMLGSWCGVCANLNKRLGIEAAHQAARERGGECLTSVYQNTTKKMHWLCHRGHDWHAPFASIRAGHWCAQCAHMARITNPKSLAVMRYRVMDLPVDDRGVPHKPRRRATQAAVKT